MSTDGQIPGGDDAARDMDELFSSDRDRGDTIAPPSGTETGQPRDEHGRFATREQDPGQPQEATPTEPQEPELEAEQPGSGRHVPNVPIAALTAERQKFQGRIDELQRQMEERDRYYASLLQNQQAQQREPTEPPDFFEDPDAAFDVRLQQYLTPFQQQMQQQQSLMFNMMENIARQTHGEVLDEAQKAAETAGILGQFAQQPDPYNSLVNWYKNQQAVQEIGGDLGAYKQRLEQEVRQKVLAELKGGQGQPQPQLPSTLADRTNAGMGVEGQLHPEQELNAMFSSNRDRRLG